LETRITTNKYSRTEDDGLDRPTPRELPDGIQTEVTVDNALASRLDVLGIPLPPISVLPRNILVATSADDFVFESMTSTIRPLGRQAGVLIEALGSHSYRTIKENDDHVVAPVIQVTHAFLIEGGAALLTSFLEHLARDIASRWGAKAVAKDKAFLELVVTKGKQVQRVTYHGPVSGLPTVADLAKAVFPEDVADGDR
jgi:hypothetical protein